MRIKSLQKFVFFEFLLYIGWRHAPFSEWDLLGLDHDSNGGELLIEIISGDIWEAPLQIEVDDPEYFNNNIFLLHWDLRVSLQPLLLHLILLSDLHLFRNVEYLYQLVQSEVHFPELLGASLTLLVALFTRQARRWVFVFIAAELSYLVVIAIRL